VPQHLTKSALRLPQIDKVEEREVRVRLKTEIDYCEARAEALRQQERAGRETRLSAENMRKRADEMEGRLQRRLEELVRERCIAPKPPQLIGSAFAGLAARTPGTRRAGHLRRRARTRPPRRRLVVADDHAGMKTAIRAGFEPTPAHLAHLQAERLERHRARREA
jgi:hypothetical protein